jgi:hypothetical protein
MLYRQKLDPRDRQMGGDSGRPVANCSVSQFSFTRYAGPGETVLGR